MYIRRFLIKFFSLLVIVLFSSILIYQNYHRKKIVKIMSYENSPIGSIAKTNNGNIQVYDGVEWKDLIIKGVQINSFSPGYSRNKSGVKKQDVMKWLNQISEMNANVITIPNIQPPSFYNAIYDYNLQADKPLYIIHEIPIDERAILKHFDAYDSGILKYFKRDILHTIDVVHGNAFLIDNSRHHAGIYLKDISAYVIGYIIGANTNAELVTLTNQKYFNNTMYEGKYFDVIDGETFDVFVAEILDFAANYEANKYQQSSILSFLCSLETDPIQHKNETNVTKYANINLENIIDKPQSKLFGSYTAHPNMYDFFDFEDRGEFPFYDYLVEINNHHSLPVLISDIGIPSSRGMSKVDIDEGFNRGNASEDEQGRQIVELLNYIYKSDSAGAVIYGWQDDWGKTTAFNLLDDYMDQSSSTYWFDAQASDESFGLMAFRPGEKESIIYIDGVFNDWENIPSLSENYDVKVTSDTSYLYIYFNRQGFSLTNDKIYIGLDITPLSGSKYWEDKVEFPIEIDFILEFLGYNESRIVVQERYNIFNYLYKYYSNLIEKQESAPSIDSDAFSAIYLLNRKNFYYRESSIIEPPIYYQTGRLVYGNANPNSEDYNSLADFNKEGDALEVRIPWILLNVKNPLKKSIQGDFYSKGLEDQISIKDIKISLYYESTGESFITEKMLYKIPNYKHMKYHQVLKKSYWIIKEFWK